MTKREKGADRRARLDQVQREQKAAARKRNVLTAVIGVSAGVLILGGTAFAISNQEKNKPENKALSAFGVSAADANCGDVSTEKSTESGQHVGPGTDKADITKVTYATVPPTSGQHFPTWLPSSRNFYAADDEPVVEQVEHNLEHGYTVVWYATTLPKSDIAALEGLSANIASSLPDRKFLVVPWNPQYGALPADKTVAISHWGAKNGFRQLCGQVSGEAIQQFVQDHPSTDSPEPNAA